MKYRSRQERVVANLKEGEVVFDSSSMDIDDLGELDRQGLHPVCCRCGARLEFALSRADTRRKKIRPGVRCPQNLNHCQIIIELAKEDPL